MSNTEAVKVKDIMTKKIIALHADDGLEKATKLFEEHNFDGFPVVNEDGKLLGIVTAYDMVSQSYATHLPSLLHILESLYNNQADQKSPENSGKKMVEQDTFLKTEKIGVSADK